MLRTFIFTLVVCVSSTCLAHGRYGRSDATHSPAYHSRHYQAHCSPNISITIRSPRVSSYYQQNFYYNTVPRLAPSYTPIDYRGEPYGYYSRFRIIPRSRLYYHSY